MSGQKSKNIVVIGLSLLLLGGAGVDSAMRQAPKDMKPYHEAIARVGKEAPDRIGDWNGVTVPTPESAIKLLQPNLIISKHFTNIVTGQSVEFLMVQCPDTRTLLGHYPPVCYPGQGWTLMNSREKDWQVGNLTITGTEYEFLQPSQSSRVIANFMVLPNGTIGRDMKPVEAAEKNIQMRYYGAAQVQVVMDMNMPEDQRDEIVRTLVNGHRAVIDAIRAEGRK